MLLRDDLLLAMTRLNACDDARSWLTSCPAHTFADLWDACPRGDWLLWLAGRLPGLEAQVGRATAAVARLALAAIPDELDPTSAYEVAWGVGDCLLDVTRGSIDEQRSKVLARTAEAVRSVLGAEEVEEALAALLWSAPGAGVAA